MTVIKQACFETKSEVGTVSDSFKLNIFLSVSNVCRKVHNFVFFPDIHASITYFLISRLKTHYTEMG